MVLICVLQGLGIEWVISYIIKFGFQCDELLCNFFLVLGIVIVILMEIVGVWSVFVNGGYKVNLYVIECIESCDGQVLYQVNLFCVLVEEQVVVLDVEDVGNFGDFEYLEIVEGEGLIEVQ